MKYKYYRHLKAKHLLARTNGKDWWWCDSQDGEWKIAQDHGTATLLKIAFDDGHLIEMTEGEVFAEML